MAIEARRRVSRDHECECPAAPRRLGSGCRQGERGNGKSNAKTGGRQPREPGHSSLLVFLSGWIDAAILCVTLQHLEEL
jgi:hypothetical protein